MGGEGRRLKRRHLIYYLEVHDAESGELIGHVVDITVKGVKLVSKAPIAAERIFKMRMKLPEEYFHGQILEFSGRSLWSHNDVNPDFYDTGFAVKEFDDEARKVIHELIEHIGFNDFSGDTN